MASRAQYAAESMPLKGYAGAQGDSSRRPANWKVEFFTCFCRVPGSRLICKIEHIIEQSFLFLPQEAVAAGYPEPTYESDQVKAEIQRGFLRKVYSILCVQLLCTVGFCWAVMAHPGRFFS